MLPIFLPDMKYHQIENSVTPVAIAETRDIIHTSPADRLCFIDRCSLQAALASHTLNSMKIDDVDVAVTSTIGTSIEHFIQDDGRFDTITGTHEYPVMMIPFRRKVVINVTNTNAAANNLTWKMWAMVHQDRKKEYQTVSSMQGQ